MWAKPLLAHVVLAILRSKGILHLALASSSVCLLAAASAHDKKDCILRVVLSSLYDGNLTMPSGDFIEDDDGEYMDMGEEDDFFKGGEQAAAAAGSKKRKDADGKGEAAAAAAMQHHTSISSSGN